MFAGKPVRHRVVVLPLVAQDRHAVPVAVQESQCGTDQGARQVHFPGHVRAYRQHAPDHRAVQEADQQGDRDRAHVAAQDAADEHEGEQSVDQARGADVQARPPDHPCQQAGAEPENRYHAQG